MTIFVIDTGTYVQPNLPIIETPTVRHIQVGALYDRFGDAKWAILVDTNPGVRALIKDCSVRKFIDLNNPQMGMGLTMLEAAGHAIDKEAILNQPIQSTELP